MAQLKLDITAQRKRIFDALCNAQGVTIEQFLEPSFAALESHYGGIDHGDSPADQDASISKLERKALKIKSDRDAAQAAIDAAQKAAQATP